MVAMVSRESRRPRKGFARSRALASRRRRRYPLHVTRSDADLLEILRRGDRSAIDELLRRYERTIYRFGLRMCGDEDAAREVLQETMIAAFRHLPEFRGDAALSTWLYRIARSFCLKERRREHPDDPLEDTVATSDPAPDARVHAREIGAALAAAIGALSPEHREVIVLRDVEGLSAEEAAGVVGVETGALKSRLHRARVELRRHLTALLNEAEGAEPGATPPCRDLAETLSAYASAEIDQAACAQIEEHLARCPRCASACATLRRSVSLCRGIPDDEEVPAAVRAAVRRSLHALTIG
jgi:RNA polymerase sigma-70 factor, ECF subfamily